MYESGYGCKHIAKQIGIGVDTVRTVIDRLGIKQHRTGANVNPIRTMHVRLSVDAKEKRRKLFEKYRGFRDLPLFSETKNELLKKAKNRATVKRQMAMYHSCPWAKAKLNLRKRIGKLLRGHCSATGTIGCSKEQLKAHLEAQFKTGMTWANYGSQWHVDHIIPLASAESVEHMARLNHYTNLQPLWAWENRAKGATVPTASGRGGGKLPLTMAPMRVSGNLPRTARDRAENRTLLCI